MPVNKFARCPLLIIIVMAMLTACSGAARKNKPSGEAVQADPADTYQAYDHFVKGDLYEQSGNFDAAADEYRKALIYDPNSVEIKRSLSEVYFQQRKFDEAALLRSEIAEKNVDDCNFIGDCLRYKNDLEGAADYYQRSLALDSTQYAPRFYVARILEYLGKTREAEKHYKVLINISPDKLESALDLASFYLKSDQLTKALETYSRAAAMDTSDMRALVGIAAISLANGDSLKADSLYMIIAQKNWDDAQVLGSLIISMFNAGDFTGAEKLAERITELTPDDPGARKRYAMLLYGNEKFERAESLLVDMEGRGEGDAGIFYYIARIRQEKKDLPGAEEYFRKSIAENDTMPDSWVNLALVIDARKRYLDALDVMRQAISAVPQDSNSILFFTALIHSRNSHYDLARDGYRRLIKSLPDNLDIRFSLAAAYERQGQYDDAEREFKTILKKDPNHAMTLNYLGYMYADRGVNLKQSREMIERALSLDPENSAYLDSYAWVLYKLGKYEDALVQMKRALKYEQQDALLYEHQGDIYFALKNDEMARESWNRALEINPENESVRNKLNSR